MGNDGWTGTEFSGNHMDVAIDSIHPNRKHIVHFYITEESLLPKAQTFPHAGSKRGQLVNGIGPTVRHWTRTSAGIEALCNLSDDNLCSSSGQQPVANVDRT